MEGHYVEIVTSQEMFNVVKNLCSENILKIEQICYRYGDEESDVRKFNTYYLYTENNQYIVKKVDERELFNYTSYLNNHDLSVPKLLGAFVSDEKWILIERIDGEDLTEMTDNLAEASASSLAEIQNAYWEKEGDTGRFVAYWKRILKRAAFVAEDELLRNAYQLFLDRQLTCPRTLSMGDCLQENLISKEGKVYMIDWGFGGLMPYSLDIARFIAHGSEERVPFPYYITERQKEIFINSLYEKLNIRPRKDVFIRDIQLSLLNEYVEFVEADEDEDGWYLLHARELARKIIEEA